MIAVTKLTPCPMTVASAAPKTCMPKYLTNRMSSTVFRMAAIAMNTNGLRLSPMPRRIALTML